MGVGNFPGGSCLHMCVHPGVTGLWDTPSDFPATGTFIRFPSNSGCRTASVRNDALSLCEDTENKGSK